MLFKWLFKSKMDRVLHGVLEETKGSSMEYRELHFSDMELLKSLIDSQAPEDLNYFSPHGFDIKSMKAQFRKPSFLMLGIFSGQKLTGYFFLRFFANKKCFVGRLIDKDFRGKGIGGVMNTIMYETAWRMGFRCLSTISRNNIAVMRAHAKNPTMLILKELQNDYLLVEFTQREKKT